jgi:hypothetical protein
MSRHCDCGHHHSHHDHDHDDHHDSRRCECDRCRGHDHHGQGHDHGGKGHDHDGHPRGCGCGCGHDGHGDGHDGHGEDGTTLGWNNPNRPGHVCGTSTGQVPGGTLGPGNFGSKPGNEWPGPRNELYLPFLFMRANQGDLGARAVIGPFWESPDILLLAGVDPAVAPAKPPPPALGDTALAGRPNTLYAHVWNFGLAQAPNVIVEFYWCDPSLGIGPSSANLIGQTMLSLGARGSGRAHAVAKCPVGWFPTFVNGGHECLVVRIWEETSDGLGTPPWDAALNRHVAQRNIHVIAAADQHALLGGAGGGPAALADLLTGPLTLKVGPLYGEPAQVGVERVAPHAMPWLQLRTGVRGQFPAQAAPTGQVVLGAPRPVGGGPNFGGQGPQQQVTGDDQQVTFATGDAPPAPGQAHVYRVTASQQGQVFGGYTVVLLG